MAETKAEEITRLQREIGERQQRLQFLVLGDPRQSTSLQSVQDYVPPARNTNQPQQG